MTTMQVHTRTRTTRRAALGLLTTLAVTLGTIAAPLAGTAHAGGARGGVVQRGPVAAGFRSIENGPGVTVDADWSKPGGVGDGIHITGAKPGVHGGM